MTLALARRPRRALAFEVSGLEDGLAEEEELVYQAY